jgi:hypothetical protein
MASIQRIGTMTIASGQQDSNRLNRDAINNMRNLSIIGPAALTGVTTLETGISDDDATSWRTVQSPPGTDVAIAALKAIPLTEIPFPTLRIHSTLAEAADRVFTVWGEVGQ